TRTRYGNTGTQATVEGISISGVGHQLPMAGQLAYAISFLGLDGTTPSPSPSPSPPPTPSPTPSPSPSPSGTPSPSPSPTAGSGPCRVSATVNAWNNGLTENLTITNTGSSAVNGWSLVFTLPGGQTITNGWNATYSPTSGQVTAANVSYNGSLAPGASTEIGFQATHTGNAGKPTAFTLNGVTCSVA
ncbi:cellulose binding domain-containing protein, partial [Microbispora sp. NEAU-D428]|uniref:cellulose binding domain-containing protein n=1 Tax=Microbispora sitophila TaxID=2771537 RepID=UPI001868E061